MHYKRKCIWVATGGCIFSAPLCQFTCCSILLCLNFFFVLGVEGIQWYKMQLFLLIYGCLQLMLLGLMLVFGSSLIIAVGIDAVHFSEASGCCDSCSMLPKIGR